MHPAAFSFVATVVAKYPPHAGARVLEIGARDINGSIRAVFASSDVRYLGTDIAPGPGVDLVADGATLTLPAPADIAVCCEVLEHTPEAEAIIANLATLLEPGGRIIITAAGQGDGWARAPHSAVDGCALKEGEYYGNISEADLREWLDRAGFVKIKAIGNVGWQDVYATAVKGWEHHESVV